MDCEEKYPGINIIPTPGCPHGIMCAEHSTVREPTNVAVAPPCQPFPKFLNTRPTQCHGYPTGRKVSRSSRLKTTCGRTFAPLFRFSILVSEFTTIVFGW